MDNEPSSKGLPGLFERCLHAMTLACLTIAQPLLDLLGRHAEFFVAHRFTRTEVGLLIVSLLLLIPLPAVALELLVARAPRGVRAAVHGMLIAFFAALFWALALKSNRLLSPGTTVTVAGLAGLAIAVAYLRARWLRQLASLLALAIAVVPAVFLAGPQIRKITSSREASFLELPAVASTAPIVFVVFDEFPISVLLDERGRINGLRYPNLAALAETSWWFPQALSVAEFSEAAMPAILAGTYPTPTRLPTLDDYPHNLFTLFGGHYDIWAREPMSELCPPELNRRHGGETSTSDRLRTVASDLGIIYMHLLLPEAYARGLPPIDAAWRDFAVPTESPDRRKKGFFKRAVEASRRDRRQEIERFVAAIRDGSRPGLYFLHILLPHRPWEFLPRGQRYFGTGPIPGFKHGVWSDDAYLVRQAYQRTILQVQFLDTAVGRVVRRLEEQALFDRSVVVLVGDHGASYRQTDQRRLVTETNAQAIIPVPLLIKAPGQREGHTVEHPVRVIDALPTVMELLGIVAPWRMDGRSAFDTSARSFRFVTRHRGTLAVDPAVHRRKYRTVRWKLRVFGSGEDPLDIYRIGPADDLFGLRTDELTHRDSSGWIAAINDLDSFQSVDLSDSVPVFVTGHVLGGGNAMTCCRLAIALNGTVVATTKTHTRTGSRRRFSVLLPMERLREGANRLEVFRVLDGEREVSRLPLGTTS